MKARETIGELAHNICHMVGIACAGMEVSAQESPALDHFIQTCPDPDLRAHLSVWRSASMSEVADAVAHCEAAKPLALGSERHPVTVIP